MRVASYFTIGHLCDHVIMEEQQRKNESLSTYISTKVEELVEQFKCQGCSNPECDIRVATCGHYVCRACLARFQSQNKFKCPNCLAEYDPKSLDFENDRFKNAHSKLMELAAVYNIKPKNTTALAATMQSPALAALDQYEGMAKEPNYIIYEGRSYQVIVTASKCIVQNMWLEHEKQICNKNEIRKFVRSDNDLNKGENGMPALHACLEFDAMNALCLLIESGALVNVVHPVNYSTPLHVAVSKGFQRCIAALLRHGADLKALDAKGLKPQDWTDDPKILAQLSIEGKRQEAALHKLFISGGIAAFCDSDISLANVKMLNECGVVSLVTNFSNNPKMTHFVYKKTDALSAEVLYAILLQLQFVPENFLDTWMTSKFINIPQFHFFDLKKLNNGVRRAMMNGLLMRPKLFDGISFYLHGKNVSRVIHDVTVDRVLLMKLIRYGGGRLLMKPVPPNSIPKYITDTLPYHTRKNGVSNFSRVYVLFDDIKDKALCEKKELHQLYKPITWFINCIITFKILE